MKANVIRGREAATCAGIGAVGALVFLFAFPAGSISTLMHAVLGLPGPGAGVALVLGPFLIVVALLSSLVSEANGGAVMAALVFAVVYALAAWLLAVPTNPKGAFGSPLFITAVAHFGVVAEVVMMLGRPWREPWRCMLCGALANTSLLVFYWTVVFPRTAGWIDGMDIPLLTALCLVCGLVSGCVAWGISRSLSRVGAFENRE